MSEQTAVERAAVRTDDPLLLLLGDVAKRGRTPTFEYGGTERILVTELDDIHQVLAQGSDEMRATPVTDAVRRIQGDGLLLSSEPRWRPRRLVIQRNLAPSMLKPKARIIADNTQNLIDRWSSGATVDLKTDLTALALDNLGDVVFGSDFSSARETVRGAIEATLELLDEANAGTIREESRRRLEDSVDELDVFVGDLVAARRGTDDPRDDILDVLVRTAASGDQVFADPWARDESVTLILAGHDTLAFLMVMCAWLLAKHPELRARLRQEVESARANGAEPHDLAAAAPLARWVVEEALRLFPPVPILHRTTPEDYRLGDRDVAAGTILVVSPWLTHRDARFFEGPEAFDPDRFAPSRRSAIPKHAYYPFGAGRRICAGNHFSLLQAVIVVASLATDVDIELLDDEPPLVRSPVSLVLGEPIAAAVHAR